MICGNARDALDEEVAAPGKIKLAVFSQQPLDGQRAHVVFEAVGLADVHHVARLVHQLKYEPLGGSIQPVDGFEGGVGQLGFPVRQRHAPEHAAILFGHIVQHGLVGHARRVHALSQQALFKAAEIDHIEVAGAVRARRSEQQAIGVDGDEAIRRRTVDGPVVPGQPYVALAVCVSGQHAAAHDRRGFGQRPRKHQAEYGRKHRGRQLLHDPCLLYT